ncbi:MAG: hypothetical protein OEL89_01330 [Candidatus Peregrinibacteria bacterium]|nr:hypothetical protein [Candidatus Peregrinibacteria bacterium]
MKKFLFWSTGIFLLILILGSFGWIYREDILKKIDKFQAKSEISSQKVIRHGVGRKVSYIGRIREAKQLIEHDYFELASIELVSAIQSKPNLFEPYELLGEIYLRTQNIEKLEYLIDELEIKFAGNRKVDILKSRKLISEKKFGEAIAILKSAENLPPELEFYKGVLLALQNDHDTARKTFNDLGKLPVAEGKLKVGESGVEEEAADEEVYVTPEFSEKIKGLSVAYQEFDELREGDNPHLFAKLSKILAENNEAILAKEFADVAIKEEVGYIDAWILRGYSNFLLRNFEDALVDLRHAYELDSIRPQTHYFLALTLLENGKDAEATLYFEKSLEHDFEFSDEVRWKLIELFTKAEKFDRVLELYNELLSADSNPKDFVKALNLSINMLQKPEMALDMTESLIQYKPDDVFTMNIHAWALIANKKFVEAEDWLSSAKELEPENPRTFLNLGLLYEEQSKYDKAMNFYKQAYEFGKDTELESITNLAAEKYNELIHRDENPESPEAPSRPENSP